MSAPFLCKLTTIYYTPAIFFMKVRVKLFKLANLKPAPGSPILSCENHNRDSCPHSPLTPSLLTSHMEPIIGAGISSLRNCEKQFSFQGQLSPDLLASPFLNNNKLYFRRFLHLSFLLGTLSGTGIIGIFCRPCQCFLLHSRGCICNCFLMLFWGQISDRGHLTPASV